MSAKVASIAELIATRAANESDGGPERGHKDEDESRAGVVTPDHILVAIAMAAEALRGSRLAGNAKVEATKELAETFVDLLFTRMES